MKYLFIKLRIVNEIHVLYNSHIQKICSLLLSCWAAYSDFHSSSIVLCPVPAALFTCTKGGYE